jgi:predicted ArsR family transcriptional regulator
VPAASIRSTLAALGYEPEAEAGGEFALRNCPFHALVLRSEHRTCAMNQAFLEGVLEGLGDSDHRAELAPMPGYCCVRLVTGSVARRGRRAPQPRAARLVRSPRGSR